MVRLSLPFFKKLRNPTRKYLRVGFRDTLEIHVKGGTGGNGLPKFGGIGGKGGDVVAVATPDITLETVYKQNRSKLYAAESGKHSSHNFIVGIPGEDLKIPVPVGVALITELGKKLGELNKEDETLIIAKGGSGGNPKNGYLGTKGQAYQVNLDLKLIADIGLVGFPNAGKSTLLKAISHSKPKIASYPFTTVKPNVGIMMYKDLRQISMADLPGLIEGAHKNIGMGHKFLKHVERTKLLLMIVDIDGFQLSPQHTFRSCLDTIILLMKELELYDENLLKKPSMLLVNKMDTTEAQKKYEEVYDCLRNLPAVLKGYPEEHRPIEILKFHDIVPISAKESPQDVEKVKLKLRNLLDVLHEIEFEEQAGDIAKDLKHSLKERGPALL